MNAKELKNGKIFYFNKCYVGYCPVDKMYCVGKHFTSIRLFQFDTFKELKNWLSFNKCKLIINVKDYSMYKMDV